MRNVLLQSLVAVIGLSLANTTSLTAGEKGVNLKVGDKAPTFMAMDDQGKKFTSKEHVGKGYMVVYFYPADMTGGCTKQACGFRDDFKILKKLGIKVVGVSGDSVKNHQIFKKAYELNFVLLADMKGDVAKAFGVPLRAGGKITRKVGGKEIELARGVTASRWTFLIGPKGTILYKNTKVNAAQDSKNIIKIIQDK